MPSMNRKLAQDQNPHNSLNLPHIKEATKGYDGRIQSKEKLVPKPPTTPRVRASQAKQKVCNKP